jgi:hypothetical protein
MERERCGVFNFSQQIGWFNNNDTGKLQNTSPTIVSYTFIRPRTKNKRLISFP